MLGPLWGANGGREGGGGRWEPPCRRGGFQKLVEGRSGPLLCPSGIKETTVTSHRPEARGNFKLHVLFFCSAITVSSPRLKDVDSDMADLTAWLPLVSLPHLGFTPGFSLPCFGVR